MEKEKDKNPSAGLPETFPILCLNAFNETLGTSYCRLPPKVARFLGGMDGRYTVDEVQRMIAFKRDEWRGTKQERHLTLNTLLGPDHFEDYMQVSRGAKGVEDEFAIYDHPKSQSQSA